MSSKIFSIGLFFLLLTAGCSFDQRVPVSGKITINGEPLPMAMIDFVPMDKVISTRAGANTDANGAFSIPKQKGLEPGEYSVSIYASLTFDTKTKELATGDTPEGRTLIKVLTPPEYNDATTLRFTVNSKGPNVYECDVKSKVSRTYGH